MGKHKNAFLGKKRQTNKRDDQVNNYYLKILFSGVRQIK